jgi:heptosyltransferase-2
VKPERVLVRAPTWLGDAVMATPALRALRAAWPAAEIAVEGRPPIGELLRGLASFDRFLADPGGGGSAAFERARRLRAGRFDLAVLLPDSPRAALAPFLARIPRRVGYARDPLRRALLSEALAPPRSRGRRLPIPMSERYLRIARHLGCRDQGLRLELAVDPAADEALGRELARRGAGSGERLLAVAPGAAYGPAKRWPAGHFAAAAELLARRFALLPVIAPGPLETGLARAIAGALRVRALVLGDPPLDVERLKALVARAALVLTNDSGPRQLAVAFDRPVLVAMGPSDPRHTAQHLERQRVLREPTACSPCGRRACPTDHRCLTHLRPERVLAAAGELLG